MNISNIIKKPNDKRFINLEGERFSSLYVVAYGGKWGKTKRKTHYWYCKCDCGNFTLVTSSNLKNGNVKSCGCKSSKKENLEGKKFGRLTVFSENEKSTPKNVRWNCICECGNKTVAISYNLKSGHTQSCGCMQKQRASDAKLEDIVGNKYGRLTVIKRATLDHQPKWLCKCECGNETIAQGLHLKSGHTQSCGCLSIEKSTERISEFAGLKGEENPNYNPLLSDEEREKGRFLHKDKLNKWRADVFARDNYTCKHCRKVGGNLHAHHLDGYHWAKDKRFDVNNGVTLCEKCHRSFHKQFGMKNNTKEQFENFITVNKSAN